MENMLICRWIVDQINGEPRIRLAKIVADMPERHDMKNMIGSTGYHACEYCKIRGMTAGKGGVFWPYPQCVPTKESLRTHAEMKEVARYCLMLSLYYLRNMLMSMKFL